MTIEVGDRVTRQGFHQTYRVTATHPCDDYNGNTQVWANLEDLRTGKVCSEKVTNLELLKDNSNQPSSTSP